MQVTIFCFLIISTLYTKSFVWLDPIRAHGFSINQSRFVENPEALKENMKIPTKKKTEIKPN